MDNRAISKSKKNDAIEKHLAYKDKNLIFKRQNFISEINGKYVQSRSYPCRVALKTFKISNSDDSLDFIRE
ncbi:18739_t:CDS:2, partial [Racocetra persica]